MATVLIIIAFWGGAGVLIGLGIALIVSGSLLGFLTYLGLIVVPCLYGLARFVQSDDDQFLINDP